jgi:hypothetical protein
MANKTRNCDGNTDDDDDENCSVFLSPCKVYILTEFIIPNCHGLSAH